jgi:hypothetical protein
MVWVKNEFPLQWLGSSNLCLIPLISVIYYQRWFVLRTPAGDDSAPLARPPELWANWAAEQRCLGATAPIWCWNQVAGTGFECVCSAYQLTRLRRWSHMKRLVRGVTSPYHCRPGFYNWHLFYYYTLAQHIFTIWGQDLNYENEKKWRSHKLLICRQINYVWQRLRVWYTLLQKSKGGELDLIFWVVIWSRRCRFCVEVFNSWQMATDLQSIFADLLWAEFLLAWHWANNSWCIMAGMIPWNAAPWSRALQCYKAVNPGRVDDVGRTRCKLNGFGKADMTRRYWVVVRLRRLYSRYRWSSVGRQHLLVLQVWSQFSAFGSRTG